MAHRTATAHNHALAAPFGWSLAAPLLRAVRLLYEAYGEGLDMARKAQRRGIFVE